MSKIKIGGLDQYGKVLSLNGIGGERLKINKLVSKLALMHLMLSNRQLQVLKVLKPITRNSINILRHKSHTKGTNYTF